MLAIDSSQTDRLRWRQTVRDYIEQDNTETWMKWSQWVQTPVYEYANCKLSRQILF